MTRMAPPRRIYHDSSRIDYAGGVFSDSAAGSRDARKKKYAWIDKNGHWMPTSRADLDKPKNQMNLTWVNAHGYPFTPDYIDGKFEQNAFRPTKAKHPTLQSAIGTFKTCKRNRLSIEWEMKDVSPLISDANLERMFKQLAESARKVFGTEWHKRVIIKCLTNLGGGIEYCKRVLKAAYKAGFETMALCRGYWVDHVLNEVYITWNRNGRVK